MSAIYLQPSQPFDTTFSRSYTFPKCRTFIAQDRVYQIASHLSRSNTLDSLKEKSKQTMALDTAPQYETANQATTTTPQAEKKNCDACGQDLKFKARPKTNKDGMKNIDDDVPDTENQLVGLPKSPSTLHRDFIHCMPPENPVYRKHSIFTAGSIEMGAAVQWQKTLANHLSDLPITVLNPRRGNWDPTDTPKADNVNFKSQVEWELDALERANIICFFFDVTTRSPITLLELGLWAASKKIIVCCNEKYWRSGNVEIVCRRYGIPFERNFKDLVPAIRTMLLEEMELDTNGDVVGPNEPTKNLEILSPLDFNAHPKLPAN